MEKQYARITHQRPSAPIRKASVNGMLFASGQIAPDPPAERWSALTIQEQTEQAIKNVTVFWKLRNRSELMR